MVNVPVMDVKRESPATATVIVPAVKQNAVALNKIQLLVDFDNSVTLI